MPSEGDAQLVASIESKARDNPGNIALRAFDLSYYTSLSDGDQTDFVQCICSAVENPDSSMGCYACQPSDFDRFKPFFSKVLAAYHKVDEGQKHVSSTDWSVEGIDGLPDGGVLDVAELGINDMSMRVRVARNLTSFPLPGAMTKSDRINFEKTMLGAFAKLIEMPTCVVRDVTRPPEQRRRRANPALAAKRKKEQEQQQQSKSKGGYTRTLGKGGSDEANEYERPMPAPPLFHGELKEVS